MTSEEIKAEYSMRDILIKCGLPRPNRKGFISCPFHKEKTASMKIYEKDYNCFGCGANGDIFTFIQQFYGIPFREAFLMLGGTYEHEKAKDRFAIYHAKKAQEMRKKQKEKDRMKRKLNNDLIDIYRDWIAKSDPLSQTWCDYYNALQIELYHHEILNEKRTGS